MKKRVVVICCTCLSAMSTMQADTYPYLLFKKADGTAVSVASASVEMTVSDGNLVVSDGVTMQTICLADLKSMAFSADGATAIEGTLSDVSSGSDDKVSIYTTSGVHVGDYGQLSEFTVVASKGVYVVKSKNKTYKTVVR